MSESKELSPKLLAHLGDTLGAVLNQSNLQRAAILAEEPGFKIEKGLLMGALKQYLDDTPENLSDFPNRFPNIWKTLNEILLASPKSGSDKKLAKVEGRIKEKMAQTTTTDKKPATKDELELSMDMILLDNGIDPYDNAGEQIKKIIPAFKKSKITDAKFNFLIRYCAGGDDFVAKLTEEFDSVTKQKSGAKNNIPPIELHDFSTQFENATEFISQLFGLKDGKFILPV